MEQSERDALEGKIDELEAVLHQIRTWCNAYPVAVFPEPDWSAVNDALKAKGIALDTVSASNMRHVTTGVVKIIEFSGVLVPRD